MPQNIVVSATMPAMLPSSFECASVSRMCIYIKSIISISLVIENEHIISNVRYHRQVNVDSFIQDCHFVLAIIHVNCHSNKSPSIEAGQRNPSPTQRGSISAFSS